MDGTHQSRLNRHLKEISRLVDAQKIHEIKNLKSVCNALNPQILHYYHDRNSRENSKAIIESQSPSSHFRSLLPIKKPLKGSRIHCEYSNGRATPFTLHADGHSTRQHLEAKRLNVYVCERVRVVSLRAAMRDPGCRTAFYTGNTWISYTILVFCDWLFFAYVLLCFILVVLCFLIL